MSLDNRTWLQKGLKDGIPIALGYFAVSFTLGITAKNAGLTALQAMLASFTLNASAGEFAGFTLIAAGAGYLEIAIMEFVANARYLLMSCALSQKLSPDTPLWQRLLIGYDVTDEIFGISALQDTNVDKLMKCLTKYMAEGPMYYPEDMATDNQERFIVSEIIR